MRLSLTYHPSDFLLNRFQDWVPGLTRLEALITRDNKLYFFDGESFTALSVNSPNGIHLIKLRNRKSRYAWVRADFFSSGTSQVNTQLGLESELDHFCLALFIPNNQDQQSDIYLLEFPKHVNPFRMRNSTINLTTEDKEQIGALLYSVCSSEYQRQIQDRKLMELFSSGQENLKKELEQTQRELNELKAGIEAEKREKLVLIVNEIAVEMGIPCYLSEAATEKLMSEKWTDQTLKRTLTHAAELERVTQFMKPSITISGSFLEKQESKGTPDSSSVSSKYDKTIALLDKYESAAMELTKEQIPVNGKHIAERLQVTPPALTDAVKKSTMKIKILLENHTERWPLIRQYLKPVHRIDARSLSA